MAEVTDPALLAQLDPPETPQTTGKVTDPATLAALNGTTEVAIQAPPEVASGLRAIWNDPNGTADQYIGFAAQHGFSVDPAVARDKFAHRKGYRLGQDIPATAIEQPPQPKAPDESVSPLRQKVSDAVFDTIDQFMPGVGTVLRDHADTGRAYTEHAANAVAGDYGPEIGGVMKALASPSEWGDFAQNVKDNAANERAILEHDSQGHPIASTAGELTGAGLAAPIAGEAVDAIPAVADAAEAAPKLVSAAKAAAGGAVYGSGAAGPGNRVAGGVTGAAIGSLSSVAPAVVKGVLSSSAGSAASREFADAAARQGVDYMAADVPGAWKSKFATALSSLTLGAIPLVRQGEKNVASAASAAARIAGDIGTAAADSTGAGQAARHGAEAFIGSTADTLDKLESKIPIPATAPAVVNNTRTALANLADSFASNPKLAAAFRDPRIASYLDALTPQTTQEATGILDAAGKPVTRDVTEGGGLSWQDLRDFRSRVGQIIGKPGLASDGAQIGQLRALYGALSDDIRQTAAEGGPGALSAWSRWNNYARARSSRIENVVSLILGNDGNKAPQTAFEALQRLGNLKGGDPIKLAQALRSMPPEEANSVRATILDDLGHASAGRQDAKGTVFGPAQWVTDWNKISDRAKNVLFTGEHRKALDDLATVFSGMKSSTKFANTSKTGISVVTGANVAALFTHPVLGPLALGLEYGGGKLLASPAFARKLAATPMNRVAARAYWSRPWVGAMANKNPAIAAEIQAFQHAFLNSANDNTAASVAAEPDQQPQDQSANAQ